MKPTLIALAIAAVLGAGRVGAQTVPAPASGDSSDTASHPGTKPDTLEAVQVSAALDRARNALSPDTGTSQTVFDRQSIQQLPQGDSTPLNQVILQAPGVVQDSFGQLHVRGDHANLQYRIDGIIIPESISGFGQTLDTRFINSLKFLTGALPAQYGYRTAGVVDITTKSGAQLGNGGSVDIYGGSYGTFNPSLELHGGEGRWSYYITANYLRSDIGIENPTSSRNPIHDHTNQSQSFGYLSYLFNPTTRATFLFGTADNRFQIPNNPNQSPNFIYGDISDFDSANLDERQREITRFGIFSLQSHSGDTDYQVSIGQRYTSVNFQPDLVGDLVFNGVASTVLRSNRADILQADFSTPFGESHLLRYGIYADVERAVSNNDSLVFPADPGGNQTSTVPLTIMDDNAKLAHTYGAYLQDQWQLTDKLVMNYGLRVDHVSAYVNEGQISPRFGLVYDFTPDTTLHAGYARYFTPPPTELIAPTDIALFQGTTNQLPTDVNTNVKSERSNYFDVGVAQKVGNNLTLGLDAYYRQVRYLQDEGQFGAALVFSPFNYQSGRVRGAEFTADYSAGPWNAYLNVSNSHALGREVISGQFNFDTEELAYIATHWVHLDHDQRLAGSGGLSYAISDATRIGGDFLYGTGLRRGFANTETMPGYFQVNLDLVHTFDLPQIGKLDTRLALMNAFDRSYELRDGSGIGVGAPQYGPRRGIYVGVSKSF
ncbi:MAG: TonB-dependent receptor [Xanthomonadales bacterium PRO7]|nr:TonB-dependent receptor [Xanthomonadales bacterium PRO7]